MVTQSLSFLSESTDDKIKLLLSSVEQIIRQSDEDIKTDDKETYSADHLFKLVGLCGKLISEQTKIHLELKEEMIDLCIMPKVQ